MKRARTIIEEKMIRIESPRFDFICQGGGGTVPGRLYYDEPWVSDEHAETLLELAKKIHYESNGSTSWVKEPELTIYWKKVSVTEKEVK